MALDELGKCISGGDEIAVITDNADLVDALNKFLWSLPRKTRNIFVRRYWYCSSIAEMLYAGNPNSVSSKISSGLSVEPPPSSTNTVTVRVVEILPDSYTSFGSYSAFTFRLVLMETITDLGDVEMPRRFYLHIREEYYTDFSQYEYILINQLQQWSYEGTVVHNATTGKAKAFELPVFSPFYYSCYYVYAFNDGVLDTSMWQSTEHWEKGFAQLESNKNDDGI